MASYFCHVVAGTKRFRLERIVRPRSRLGWWIPLRPDYGDDLPARVRTNHVPHLTAPAPFFPIDQQGVVKVYRSDLAVCVYDHVAEHFFYWL